MVMPYHLHMPSYFLETFTEYPSVSYHFVEVSSFMRISYEEKAWKRPTLYQAGTVYKKEYMADSKHIMWKSTSKRSEGMRV